MRKIKKSKPRINTNLRQTGRLRNKLLAPAIGCLVIAGSLYALSRSGKQNATATNNVESAHCDAGIASARAAHHAQPIEPINAAESDTSAIAPALINSGSGPEPAPEGMVWVPGGEFSMGSEDSEMRDGRPFHRVAVDGFWMDQTEVTNEEFARFVKATGYVTVAERKPDAKDFPGAPPENLVPGSVLFRPPKTAVPLNDHYAWWQYVAGASWRHPQGPESNLEGKEKHPVVNIAYEDAEAYAKWAGKRLPTEAEFEFAARGGLDRKRFAWGDEFKPGGKFQANTFQGHFPEKNTGEDGFIGTAPVGTFTPNGFGLFDMAGNVWEWTSDWYRQDYYQTLASTRQVNRNPQGPTDSLDPSEPGVAKRVQKGGSFLCTDQYCARYMPGARGKGEPDTGTNHLGFRCARSTS
ncbi:MAG: formylglycine-generating enzyme family protein [Pyrinomonadaceae bacterium]|nr:formylglycine-generating enzyme family protein [Pyrinomonadaceae bacterium]